MKKTIYRPAIVTIIFAIVCVAAVASSALAQETKPASANNGPSQPAAEPLSKKRLLKLLTLNDSTQPELIQIVGQKGVDFKATPSDERELHDAGASDELIVAVRANYHDGASSSAPTQSTGAIVSNADAQPNSQTGPTPSSQAAAPPTQPAPNTAAAPPPAAKKKSFLDKLNDTMNKANAARASQGGSAQTPAATQTAPPAQPPSAPTEPTNTAPPSTATTGTTQAAPPGTNATAPAQPGTDSSPSSGQPETINAPGIMASPNNIALVNGKGTGKTTLTWNAGEDHPNAEVWVKVDDQDETKVVAQGKGTLQVAVVPFKTYVYTLKDAGKMLASVTVKFHRNDVPRRISEFAPIPGRDSFKGSNASQ